jgi:aquaporin Z
MKARSLFAEGLGTALLVFFGAGTATLTFGMKITGASVSAGVVATALAFGLVLLVLVYGVGPISGCHVNPAVTIGFLVSRRITLADALGYWAAQIVGGIAGAAGLYGMFRLTSAYRASDGLGANGFGASSMTGTNAAGAFVIEIILTFLFVFVILAVTRRASNATVAGLAIGLALTLVHLIGIPVRRDLGQPGPEPRPGALRRRNRAQPALGFHPRAAGRRDYLGSGLPVPLSGRGSRGVRAARARGAGLSAA